VDAIRVVSARVGPQHDARAAVEQPPARDDLVAAPPQLIAGPNGGADAATGQQDNTNQPEPVALEMPEHGRSTKSEIRNPKSAAADSKSEKHQ